MGRVASSARAVWVGGLDSEQSFHHRRRWAAEAGLVAGMAFPVLVGAEVAGVLEFFCRVATTPTPVVMDIVSQAGVQLGRAVEPSRDDVRARGEATAATERFQIPFDDGPIGMVITDVAGRFLQANRAYCAMLGYSQDELLGMAFSDITPADELGASQELFERALTGELPCYRLEKRYVHSDAHLVWVLLNVSAVPGGGGGVAYLIDQIEDISERKSAEAILTRAALHDGLTGLPNRLLLTEPRQQARRAARSSI